MSAAAQGRSGLPAPQEFSAGEAVGLAPKVTQPPRPLAYWLAHSPPGWVSRHPAATADPIAQATKVQRLAVSLVDWLLLPRNERWDTFTLQALSAALFNRYLVSAKSRAKRSPPTDVGLLQLNWPPGSEAIQKNVRALQHLLVAPFAVFKAVRVAIRAEDLPTPQELCLADEAVVAAREEIKQVARQLGKALDEYTSPPILDA